MGKLKVRMMDQARMASLLLCLGILAVSDAMAIKKVNSKALAVELEKLEADITKLEEEEAFAIDIYNEQDVVSDQMVVAWAHQRPNIGYIQTVQDSLNNGIKVLTGQVGGVTGADKYVTRDGNFILKALDESSMAELEAVWLDHVAYMNRNPQSLIAQIFGAVEMTATGEKYCVMRNVNMHESMFRLPSGPVSSKSYDLKGDIWWHEALLSAVNMRYHVWLAEKNMRDDSDPGLRETFPRGLKYQSIEHYNLFKSQLQKDVDFLKDHGLVDYSMMMTVQDDGTVLSAGI